MSNQKLAWFKSSYSGTGGGACVEVATPAPSTIYVRDSKDPEGPHLTFGPAAWTSFLSLARARG